jgi:anti-anti-sigma factor
MRLKPALLIKEDARGKVIYIAAKGLDLVAIDAVGPELKRLAKAAGCGRLHLDLAEAEYVSGAALGVIVAMHRAVTDSGGEFVVRNVGAFLLEQFEVTRLDKVLRISPKLRERVSLPSFSV